MKRRSVKGQAYEDEYKRASRKVLEHGLWFYPHS